MATPQYLTPADIAQFCRPQAQQFAERLNDIVERTAQRFAERVNSPFRPDQADRLIRRVLEEDFLNDHYPVGKVFEYLGVPVMVKSVDRVPGANPLWYGMAVFGMTRNHDTLVEIAINQAVAEALVWAKYLETEL